MIKLIELPSQEAIRLLLRNGSDTDKKLAYYYSETMVVCNRGVIYNRKGNFHSHKWKKDGITYNFCLKCGLDKASTKHYTENCFFSAKEFSKDKRATHDYEDIILRGYINIPLSRAIPLSITKEAVDFKFKVCKKCGLIPGREKIFYMVDKTTNVGYEVSSPVGALTTNIFCNLTDDEFMIRNIII